MALTAFFKKAKIIFIPLLFFSIQSVSAQINLTVKDSPLDSVFQLIQLQSDFKFVYTNEQLEGTHSISFSVQHAALEEVLEICFKDQPLTYSVEAKFIIVRKKYFQPQVITGKVVNENDEPLSGATVTVKKTNHIVITDINGGFVINDAGDNTTLVISNVGYETTEILAKKNSLPIIRLHMIVSKLDEVQVIAYGTSTKRLNTGDVTTVKSEVIAEQPVSNFLEALEGRVPGMYISQGTGVAGGGITVQLRGQNSIAQGNDPLYVVDGVPFTSAMVNGTSTPPILSGGNPLFNINPADIESIDILKDADATAIYGSRGANGVVLINTKKGKAGKTKFDFNFYKGSGTVTRMMHLLNTKQYLEMRREAFANDSSTASISNAPDLVEWDTTKYTNWQKALIGGVSQIEDVQGSISGGNLNTQFLIGGGYHRETTVFPGNNADQKASVHLNLTHASEDQKFKMNFTASFLANNNNILAQDLTAFGLYLPPNTPDLIKSDGTLVWPDGLFLNPLAFLLQKYKENTYNLISNATMSYVLLPGLTIKMSAGFTQMQTSQVQTDPLISYNPLFGLTSGDATFSNNSIKTWILEPQINWHKNFGKHRIDLLAGSTFQEDIRLGQTLDATNFSSESLLDDIAAAANINTQVSTYLPYKYNAFFSRLTYNYAEKYLLNITGRRDGSSRFGPDRQFANFGAIGAGWIFSRENFIHNYFSFLSFGKLKASYGTTGNDQIGDYQYLATYSPTIYPYQTHGGLYPTSLFNPDFSWETNKKAEISLELGMIKDRILFTGSFYRNWSSNQLVGYPLPLITGASSVQSNLPAVVQNTGLEIELNTYNIKTKNLTWNSSFTLSIPRNKLLSYPNLDQSAYANNYVVGKSLFIKKLYHFTGVDPLTGIYQFQDVDKDGMISYPNDLQALKEVSQKFYGGLFNSFRYKRIELNFLFQFVKQTKFNYLVTSASAPGLLGNQPDFVLSRWQKPGDISGIEKFSENYSDAYNAFSNAQNYGDDAISDASFIRLKNLYLSYEFSDRTISKFHIQKCKIFLQGQNLITITKYLGMDPETGSQGYLPPLKMITAGFQLIF